VNKVDKYMRNERVRMTYKLLVNMCNLSPNTARRFIREQTFETWDGSPYKLSDKAIQSILYEPKKKEE